MRIRCLPAASRGRDLTHSCIPVHYNPFTVVLEEEGLRRVSESHMLIGELRYMIVVIITESVETSNDMPQPEVVNNSLNPTYRYILYTLISHVILFSLECSIAADAIKLV